MLHKEAVSTAILDLIRVLQQRKELSSFTLVGGTALALQIGHRKSIDIDLFSTGPFDVNETAVFLEKDLGFHMQYSHKNTLKGTINGIFVDLITHAYPLIDAPRVEENIRMASLQDIAAMKVNAISGNGTRIKDFIDVYFLLKNFSFSELVKFFSDKYDARNTFHAVKSLTYFEDVDPAGWPEMILEKDVSFEKIKKVIRSGRDRYMDGIIR